MNFQQPDHDSETLIELYGPENGGWFTTRIHDWIPLCTALRDPDVRGYLILRSLIMEKFHKPVRNLTLGGLCELIPGPNEKPSGLTRVRGILDALSNVGLICTPEGQPIKTSSRPGAAQRVLRIRINDMPPEGYAGWRNSEAKLKNIASLQTLQRAPEGAGRNSDPASEGDAGGEGAGRNSDPRGCNSDPLSGSDLRKPGHPLVLSSGEDEAASPRSGGDGRRPSGRSNAREAEGDCVASSKDSSPRDETAGDGTAARGQGTAAATGKAKHTRAQLDLVRAVLAYFPADVLNGWTNPTTGKKVAPLVHAPTLSDAILNALVKDDRSPEQLGERIRYRWDHHGYAVKFYAGQLKPGLVPAAIGMVQPLKKGDRYACSDTACENGKILGSGQDCQACVERIADHKATIRQQRAQAPAGGSNAGAVDARAAMPAPRASSAAVAPYRECAELMCGRPIAKDSDDSLCHRCRQDAGQADLVNSGSLPPF